MYIINVFHVILYIKIYFAQTRLCIVIVVNRRCDVSNAISSEISMDRKLAWVENCTGNYKLTSRENKMAGLIGTLGKFDPKTETVISYK